MSTIHGWQKKRLDEIGELFSGSTPSTANSSYWEGNVVWITPADLSTLNSRYVHHSGKQITEKGLNACSTHLLPVGSIVLSSRAPIGYVALPTVPFCTNQGCKSIKLKKGFDSEFTYYNVLFNIKRIKDLGEGTTFAEISKTALAGVELDFPQSTDEQSKIAEILSIVDHAIEQTDALIGKQQRIKAGLMHDLLTRGIDEHGALRSEQTHKFQDSPLGRIPADWDAVGLRTCLSYISYGFTNPMPDAIDGPYMVTAANISNGGIQYDSCRRTTADAFATLLTNKSRPRLGDLLITKDGTLGRLAIVDRIPLCINQSVAVMRVKDCISNHYLKLLLESAAYQRRIEEDAGGSTIKHIYISKIDKMLIALPRDKFEQNAIKQILSAQIVLVGELERIERNLLRMKSALMQELLTGRKPVTALLESKPKREKVYAGE